MSTQRLRVNIIVAMSKNSIIGNDGQIPWRIPTDLKRFRAITLNHPVIMGRKTYETLPRPLDKRTNIVLTRDKDWKPEPVQFVKTVVAHSFDQAIKLASEHCDVKTTLDGLNFRDCFIIGGGEIYKQFINHCWYILATLVNTNIEGDTEFPQISFDHFKLVKSEKSGISQEEIEHPVLYMRYQNKSTFGRE